MIYKCISWSVEPCLINFLPGCLETLVVDAEVCGQIQGHDVARASVGAGWCGVSAQHLNEFHDCIKNTYHCLPLDSYVWIIIFVFLGRQLLGNDW